MRIYCWTANYNLTSAPPGAPQIVELTTDSGLTLSLMNPFEENLKGLAAS